MVDSSTGGMLLPINDAPLNDEALDIFFAGYISSLTGLNGAYCRPRWQPEPEAAPPAASTWAAVGVIESDDDQFPQEALQADGTYVMVRHEMLGVLCSFYGDKAQQAARMARDNIIIAQNREPLTAAGIAYMYAATPIKAPVLIATRWTNRIDVKFTFRRAISETYAILNIESAQGSIVTSSGATHSIT